MAISKVILNGETLMDVTQDTVASDSLLTGKTATKNDGTKVTGNYAVKLEPLTVKSTDEEQVFDGSPQITEINGAMLESREMHSGDSNTLTSSLVWKTDSDLVIGQKYHLSGWLGTGNTEETAQRIFFDTDWVAREDLISIPFATKPGYSDDESSSFDGSIEFTDIKLSTTQIVITATAPFVVYTDLNFNNMYLSVSEIGEAYDGCIPVKVKPVKLRSTNVDPKQHAYNVYPDEESDVVYESLSAITIVSASNWNDFGGDIFESLLPDTDYYISFTIRNVKGYSIAYPAFQIFQLDGNPIVVNLRNRFGEYVGIITIDGTKFKIDASNVSDEDAIEQFKILSPIDGFSSIQVNAASLQSKTVSPSESSQMVTADSGYYGLSQVTVSAIPSTYIIPSGTYSISSDGVYDVRQYESANINVGDAYKSFYYRNMNISSESFYNTISADTSIPNGAFAFWSTNASFLSSISGLDSITSIGSYAFYSCKVQYINFSNVKYVGDQAFMWCVNLTDVILPKLQNVGSSAFYFCWKLASISLPSARYIGSFAFASCSSLSYIYIPEVQRISSYAFGGCYNLESINLPSPSCSLYALGKGAFSGCTALSIATIPNLFSVGSSAFYNCFKLASIDMPNIKQIGAYAFASCFSLESITFSKLTEVGMGAFASCSGLQSVDLPNVSSIPAYAFSNCCNLKNINAPNATQIGGSAFAYCSSLVSVEFSSVKYLDTYGFFSCRSLTTVSMPLLSVINTCAFSNCGNLKSIYFPTVTYIYGSAFCGCGRLSIADFPNATRIDYNAFAYCGGLEIANFPNVSSISTNAFANCTGLKSISFPLAQVLGGGAFYCPTFNSTTGGVSFYDYLSIINFPACTSIGGDCFAGRRHIHTAIFPLLSSISGGAFRSMVGLMSLYLFTETIPSIHDITFYDTPISSSRYTGSYGSIFVRASMVDAFKTASGWSTYSSRIVGLTDEEIAALEF